jgi:hypothetical protein
MHFLLRRTCVATSHSIWFCGLSELFLVFGSHVRRGGSFGSHDARTFILSTREPFDRSSYPQQYAPWAAYKTLWYLLGRGELNSTVIDQSLYPNNFQLFGSWSS